MIVEERLVDYLHSLETENSEILEQIERRSTDYPQGNAELSEGTAPNQKTTPYIGGGGGSWLFCHFNE